MMGMVERAAANRVDWNKNQTVARNSRDVEWLSYMEMQTFLPREAPIWGRPNLRPSTLYIPTGDANKETTSIRHPPWWWQAPMPGTDTETKMMGSAGRGSDLEGSIRAAMEVPMFPSQ